MHRSISLEALESGGDGLATVVEDEAEVDGQVEVDSEDVALDGGAEAQGGLEVDEPLQQWAAWFSGWDTHLGLDETQHVSAHAPASARHGDTCRMRPASASELTGTTAVAGKGHRGHWP
ncbi:hypothetical protein HU200_042474 [Digitaria exilis]|uniref:Uncharacterized protein n=1 Tax=Digitaria exilis TaxID=1010633 RepID=A0A835BAS5_9POAL|nr:hypothetical protein HU200_042474 [Digitaria exilis]